MNEQQQPAKNTLTVLPDGVIEMVQTGYQTTQSAWQFQPKIDALIAQNHSQGHLALVLVDLSGVTGSEPEVRDVGRDRLVGKFDAIALFGGTNVITRMIVNWLMRRTGNDPRIKFFATRDEALTWLRSHRT